MDSKAKASRSEKVSMSPMSSPLGRLPPKVRSRIYEHIVPRDHTFSMNHQGKWFCDRPSAAAAWAVALAATCKTIRDEVELMLYGNNSFVFEVSEASLKPVEYWLRRTGLRVGRYITDIAFCRKQNERAKFLLSDEEMSAWLSDMLCASNVCRDAVVWRHAVKSKAVVDMLYLLGDKDAAEGCYPSLNTLAGASICRICCPRDSSRREDFQDEEHIRGDHEKARERIAQRNRKAAAYQARRDLWKAAQSVLPPVLGENDEKLADKIAKLSHFFIETGLVLHISKQRLEHSFWDLDNALWLYSMDKEKFYPAAYDKNGAWRVLARPDAAGLVPVDMVSSVPPGSRPKWLRWHGMLCLMRKAKEDFGYGYWEVMRRLVKAGWGA